MSPNEFKKSKTVDRIPWIVGLVLAVLQPTLTLGRSTTTERALPRTGSVLEQTLAGGESHRYRLDWSQGREFWLTAHQMGIDLAVSIVTEGGESRLTVDAPNGRWGPEWMRFRVEPGDAAIEIRSISEHYPRGRYRLHLEPRSLDPENRHMDSIERTMTAAGRLSHLETRETLERTLTHYLDALAGWQDLQRPVETTNTRLMVGTLQRLLERPRESLETLRQAMAESESLEVHGHEIRARAWMEIGLATRQLDDLDGAKTAYSRSLELWRQLEDLHGQARALNFLGLSHMRTEPERAKVLYEEVLALSRALGDTRQEGVALNNLGGIHDLASAPDQALEYFEQALHIHQNSQDRRQEASVWNNMASVYRRTGRLQEALDGYTASLDARRAFGDVRGQGRVLNNLGLTWLALGDTAHARDALAQALLFRRQSEDRKGEAITLHNLGMVHADLDDWETALTFWSEALTLRREIEDRYGEAAALIALGRGSRVLSRLTRARRHLNEALSLLDDIGNPWRQAQAWWILGQVLTDSGELDSAVGILQRSLNTYRSIDDSIAEGQVLLALAEAERARAKTHGSRLRTAYDYAEEALNLLETMRSDVDALSLRTSFFSHHADAFELAIDLAMDLESRTAQEPSEDWAKRALEISERARARSLLDLLRESGVQLQRGIDPHLIETQRSLLARLNIKVNDRRQQLESRGPSAKSVQITGEIRDLRHQLDTVEEAIRQQPSPRAHSRHFEPLKIDEIQALLDPETLLLEFALGQSRSFLWAITHTDVEAFELPGQPLIAELAQDVYERFRVLDPRSFRSDSQAAEQLSRILLEPVADRLPAYQRLAIVPDGALHYLPFAALPHPQATSEPLLVHHEIVNLPSASTLGIQRRALSHRPRASRALAILADPIFSPTDSRLANRAGPEPVRASSTGAVTLAHAAPAYSGTRSGEFQLFRLPWSRWEAETITERAGQNTFLAMGSEAGLDTIVQGHLKDYRWIHLATHGVIESEHPELSALVFSLYDADGQPRDGFLRLPQIYNLELHADLVVLSGCSTALGQEVRGEGLIGLTRGFFAAGARRLMASLWQVQDRSSAELMVRFYERLFHQGELQDEQSVPALLREAQLELRDDSEFRDPYFWAAFTLYGDW